MTFQQATAYLQEMIDYERTPAQASTGLYLNLDRMRTLLERAGNPERTLRFVHIAGTKGKGSTAAMTAQILRAAGLRVGLYISPHLVTFRERMRVDGALISEDEFAQQIEDAQTAIESMRGSALGLPTFFEILTLVAFQWFTRQHVEIAVLETGLGGRLDATNVVTPLATAITTIALDHVAELGNTLTAIAGEKAGIIKPAVPVVSAPQVPEAADVIAHVAGEMHSPLYRVGDEIRILPGAQIALTGQQFSVAGRLEHYTDLRCPLLGAHQQMNAAVAIGLAECLREAGEPINAEAIHAGIAGVEWPGRLQILREHPLLVLDGAHDPAAMEALLLALDQYLPAHPRRFILGFFRDKDWPRMLRQLAPGATKFILTAAGTPRAVAPDVLLNEAQTLGVPSTAAPDIPTALDMTLAHAGPDDLICVTGSLYAVGDALRWWRST